MQLCEYGCGQKATHQFKNGKWCCSKYSSQCIINKQKNAESTKGIIPWNKNKIGCFSKEALQKISEYRKGRIVTLETRQKIGKSNRGKIRTSELKKRWSVTQKFTIKQWKERHSLFAKIEEMRYEPSKEKEKIIQVHCKNHNCKNSKEKGGWFTFNSFARRIDALENGSDGHYFYCSEQCKEECPLYGKRVSQLIKEDQIRAGIIKDPWYISQEYQVWRKKVFELDNNVCQWCGQEAIITHHILPQKTHPNLSLDPENGLSCCKECHYKYGHRDSWCTTGYLSQLACDRIIKIKDKVKEVV